MAVQHWADALKKAKKTALISDGACIYSLLISDLLFCRCIYAGSLANSLANACSNTFATG